MADGSDPLGFSIPIHYRPLVPLTNTLQFELAPVGSTYLKTHMKVLVAECISADQLVGKLSRAGWSIAARSLREAPNVQLEFGEFEQPQALRDALAQGQYDAVFISAHGHFDRQSGRTGIICGGTFVVEEELGDLPPIVCLSACQVSPRGTGSTNLGDLFLRRGAWVVIGPTVPVDVRHNAILMARFFTNVAETMQGKTDLRTLEQVWHFTTATNALNDVISTSPKVNSWALSRDPSRSTVIEEFMLRASVGRLRKGTIYADTQAVLSEMARARGFEAQFLASIRSQGYLPESAMYLTIGWPDLIVLHDPGFDSIAVKVSPVG